MPGLTLISPPSCNSGHIVAGQDALAARISNVEERQAQQQQQQQQQQQEQQQQQPQPGLPYALPG